MTVVVSAPMDEPKSTTTPGSDPFQFAKFLVSPKPGMPDPVNHPSHYCLNGIEVLDAIEAWELPYHLGNVVKYIARAGKKNPDTFLEDLKKAQFYLNRFIDNHRGADAHR